ncbi:DMT family transporter [Polyangium sp. 6x1]|uniref:EamA family transporter n=1 Tax=Polyangium sp. 6x1 TaxID=3042689 RepID=UPI0024826652|nr:DMT family transporter [Polyangium sp. 6x1]MDI1444571.1 DMT family transporter [Polyangium sp. 6x1]
MPAWTLPAIVAACFFGLHYLALRASSGRIGDALGALCLEGTAALGILAFLVVRREAESTPTSTPGVVWACLAGLCISVATTLLFTALRLGGPVAATGTLALGGGVVLSAAVAPLIFGEGFTLRRALGVALGVIAMVLLATPSGAKEAPQGAGGEEGSPMPIDDRHTAESGHDPKRVVGVRQREMQHVEVERERERQRAEPTIDELVEENDPRSSAEESEEL